MLRDRYTELQDRLIYNMKSAQTLPDKLGFLDQVAGWHQTRRRLLQARDTLSDLRKRGFTWLPMLEQQLVEAATLAPEAHAGLWLEIDHSLSDLMPRVEGVLRDGQSLAFQGEYEKNASRIAQHEASVQALQGEVSNAVTRATAAVALVKDRLDELDGRIEHLRRFGVRVEASGIPFSPGEAPVFALRCEWKDRPGGPAEGVLFLTASRVLFFQDQEVKVKTGIFSSETHQVRGLLLEAPLDRLCTADADTEGFLFTDELLVLRWAGAPDTTTFELASGEGQADFWDDALERMRSGRTAELAVLPEHVGEVDEKLRIWDRFAEAHRSISEGPERGVSREKTLHDLLLALFTADALRRFLVLELDRRDLLMELPPESASPAMFFFSTTLALLQRGLVDVDLVAALLRVRPDRAQDIRQAAAILGIPEA